MQEVFTRYSSDTMKEKLRRKDFTATEVLFQLYMAQW